MRFTRPACLPRAGHGSRSSGLGGAGGGMRTEGRLATRGVYLAGSAAGRRAGLQDEARSGTVAAGADAGRGKVALVGEREREPDGLLDGGRAQGNVCGEAGAPVVR